MGRVPLPANSFWCEAGCRLMSATLIIGCECEPWPRVKGEDAASWIKDRRFRSANFTPIRQGVGKYISADWVYQRDLWGLWPFCKPNIEDVLSQSLSLHQMTHKSLRKVYRIHREPAVAMPSGVRCLSVSLSFKETHLLSAISILWSSGRCGWKQLGVGASRILLPLRVVSCSVGRWLETVPCPVRNLSARGDHHHHAAPKLFRQCYRLFPNSHQNC